MVDNILEFIRKETDIRKICQQLKIEEYELLGVIELLKREGHRIEVYNKDGEYKINFLTNTVLADNNIFELKEKTKKIKLGVLGDTHLCCKYQQLSLINQAYTDFHNRGIKTVIHTGDMVDGDYKTRPDHIYSLFKFGATEQADYVIDMYPKVDGIKTYFIQGSHDTTHIKNGGADVGKMIASERKDMIDLGIYSGTLDINKCKIQVLHPGGGSSYAFSYKPQKIIDSMTGGEKPNMLLIGHYHKNLYMMYRNVHVVQVPSLEATTPFMVSNALINDMGYDIIEFEVNKDGNVVRFNIEHIPFYVAIKDDYKKCKKLVIKNERKH